MSLTTALDAVTRVLTKRTCPKAPRRWTTVAGPAVLVALMATGCGDDSDDADTQVEAADEPDAPEAPGDGGGVCPVEADVVGEAVGGEVTEDSLTVGGTGAGGGAASFDADGVEVTPQDRSYSVAWEGCTFLAEDGSEYLVGDLVDEVGDPDLTGLDLLVSWAEAGPDEPVRPEIGEEAFVDGTDLVVREADRTLVLSFSSDAAGGGDEEGDITSLADIADGLLSAGSDDLVSTCTEGFAAAPSAWGQPSAPLGGSGSGSIGGVEYSYESCSTDYPERGQVQVQIGDAGYFDLLAGDAEAEEEDVPELVPGVGDAAVRMKGNLYIRIGDRGLVVAGETPDGEPLGTEPVDALGAAVADTLS